MTTTMTMTRALPRPHSLLLCAALLAMPLACDGGTKTAAPSDAVGQAAPALAGQDLSGAPVSLAELRGKVVIVDFWASWCEPCEAAMPTLEGLSRAYGEALVIVGVSVDEDEAAMREFAERVAVSFHLVHDLDHAIADAWAPPKMPTTYVIDRAGNVAAVQAGYDEAAEGRLRAAIDRALAD
ncbi:thioredoxin family protein [Plesiocystis pacifica SIR-1]|uniref:Thioredoxin family protein n=1 Tax=Plesiocystis pacifica SIR-1 TaxID=391625 RepID=A6G8G4_9BACT|nr:TlpA disulfide reductase family protein [Plesiocystis pacifica]EDM77874.1 thioredoxin family protein [Plesiocystis pacifica SIR-1]